MCLAHIYLHCTGTNEFLRKLNFKRILGTICIKYAILCCANFVIQTYTNIKIFPRCEFAS